MEKDPDVEETIDDKNITEKLQREREQKRLSYKNFFIYFLKTQN